MAAYGFSTLAPANSLPSGIKQVNTILSTAKTQVLSNLSDTKFTQEHIFTKDSYGREMVNQIKANASWRWRLLDATNLPLLSTWGASFHKTYLDLINGDVVVFGDGTLGYNGVPKWKLVIDNDSRYVEMEVQRKGPIASATASIWDNDALWSTASIEIPDALFTGAATYATPGVKTFGVRNTGESNYETLGPLKSLSFTATQECDEGDEGTFVPRGTILIEYTADVMDLSPTSLAVLDSFHQVVSNDCKFTLMDGVIITCADNLGAVADPVLDGDSDKGGILRVHGSGQILTSSWAGLFS